MIGHNSQSIKSLPYNRAGFSLVEAPVPLRWWRPPRR